MGNIFNVDDQKDSSDEAGKNNSVGADSEENANTNAAIAKPRRRSTRIVAVFVGIVVLGLMAAVGVVGLYLFRSSVGTPTATSTAKEAKTKLEAFQGKAGTVLVKSYSDVGSVGRQTGGLVEIGAMELQDRTNGTRALGLIIDVKGSGDVAQKSRSFIDYDEIDSLLKGIDYINGVTAATPPLKNFEAHYRTRGDFAIITFNQNDGKISAAISGSSIGSNSVFLSTQELATLRNYVVSARNVLDKLEKP